MTAILQISDTHIAPEGTRVSGRLETSAALMRLITRINAIRNQIGPIDGVLVTGDLSDDGSAESYVRFKTLMASLDLPIHVIPGNHDARAPMRAAFADQLPSEGALNWECRIGDIRLIGVDTLVEGHGQGTLSAGSLSFLQDALSRSAQFDGLPVLLALHHPPFASGIGFMDEIRLTNHDAFRDVVAHYSGELRIVCGHIHNMMVTDIAGHIAISAPSPCSTFAYDRRASTRAGFMMLEDGCLLHCWDGRFQTIRIGPAAGHGPFPF